MTTDPTNVALVPISFVTPSQIELAVLLPELRLQHVTYAELGSTIDVELPAGYHHLRRRITVGSGEMVWERGKEAISHWQGHQFARMTITPHYVPLEEGETLIITRRLGPTVLLAPCRIVTTTNQTDRFGFSYGTLPGHPESGEESFIIERAIDGTVSFEVVAFSRPAATIAKLGGPVARALQSRIADKYLEGVRRFSTDRRFD